MEPSVSDTTQAVTTTNKIALNKIALNKIALNKIALNKIALNKIALNKIALNSLALGDLLNTADGREVLSYLLGCAFPEGVTLEGTADDGTTYEFAGEIGLAPRWADRRLTTGEQRWLSACMLARVNNDGHEITISLRGPHAALEVSADEASTYTLEEGAFYGDIFAADQRFYACRGVDLASGDHADAFALRTCAQPGEGGATVCGMSYAGDCTAVCADQEGDYYGRCHTSPASHDERLDTRFEEAITVYLQDVGIE